MLNESFVEESVHLLIFTSVYTLKLLFFILVSCLEFMQRIISITEYINIYSFILFFLVNLNNTFSGYAYLSRRFIYFHLPAWIFKKSRKMCSGSIQTCQRIHHIYFLLSLTLKYLTIYEPFWIKIYYSIYPLYHS